MKTISVNVYGMSIDITQNEDGTYNKPDIIKHWETHGSALKPAFEPIIVAMKPLDGTYAENALKYGVAGLNIDGSRIAPIEHDDYGRSAFNSKGTINQHDGFEGKSFKIRERTEDYKSDQGRFPANIILDEEAALLLDEQSGELKSSAINKKNRTFKKYESDKAFQVYDNAIDYEKEASKGGASRFFYVAKASRSERDKGLEDMPDSDMSNLHAQDQWTKDNMNFGKTPMKNNHPTVKPIKLLEYLCTLTNTPTNGIILDPFMGSGSLGIAALNTGREYLGIEIDEEYFNIAEQRIEYARRERQDTTTNTE